MAGRAPYYFSKGKVEVNNFILLREIISFVYCID